MACGYSHRPSVTCQVLVSARDLARLQTGGAHVEPLRGPFDGGTDSLNVRVPTTIRLFLRPGHVVTEAGPLGANITYGGHWNLLVA